MKNKLILLALLAFVVMVLAACGGGGNSGNTAGEGEAAPIGDAANGEKLFTSATIGTNNAPGCITCHSLEPDVVIVGPSQAGLEVRAETRVPGLSAEEYIRQSIVEPNAYIVEGFTPDVMYQNYATDLTQDQINDLIAYTLTLK